MISRLFPIWARISVTFVVAFLLSPIIVALVLGVGGGDQLVFPPSSLSGERIQAVLTQTAWRSALMNSVVGALGAVLVGGVLGVLAAWVVGEPGVSRPTTRLLYLVVPLAIPPIAMGIGASLFLQWLGLWDSFAGFVLVESVYAVPLLALVAHSTFSPAVRREYKFARSFGGSPVFALSRVLIPRVRLPLIFGWVAAFLFVVDESVVALFITDHRFSILPRRIFDSLRFSLDPAVAGVSFLVVVAWMLMGLGALLLIRSPSTR